MKFCTFRVLTSKTSKVCRQILCTLEKNVQFWPTIKNLKQQNHGRIQEEKCC